MGKTITFNGGRFGNQMYYMLQAYKSGCKYKMSGVNPSEYIPMFKLLEMDDLIDQDAFDVQHINTYAQNFGEHFTEQELEGFIKNKVLKSRYFNDTLDKFGLNDKDVCIHIRCGDYLNSPFHNCFDRLNYFEHAFKKVKNRDDIKLIVQSDDIEYCKQNYGELINRYFKNVEWYKCGTVLDDFIHLCSFKNKIIMNSTFSIWSSFISNVLFESSYKNIISPNQNLSTENPNAIAKVYNPKWTFALSTLEDFDIDDLDLNKYSLCISVNPARYEKLKNNFTKVGLSVPTLIEGIREGGHTNSCTKSHIKAMQYAKEHDFPYVVIFEDDAYPCPDVIDQFKSIIQEIKDNDIHFGCLVLGRTGEASGWTKPLDLNYHLIKILESAVFHTRAGFRTNVHKISENLITIPRNLFGSHAFIVLKDYFDVAIERFKHNIFADLSLCYNYLNTIVTKKCLFIQHNDDSTYSYPKYYNENYTGDIGRFKELPRGFTQL